MMDTNMQELEGQTSKSETIPHESRKRSLLYYALHREETSIRCRMQRSQCLLGTLDHPTPYHSQDSTNC
jgi:hypothetical protein